jgi:hypothetical protein
VVETGAGRLSRIDLATGGIEEIATGLAVGLAPIAGAAPAYVASGVAVDHAGAIHVAGDAGNVVYRITRR